MPAIDLTKLRNQTRQLVNLYEQPIEFVRLLVGILENYSNHTFRSSQITQWAELSTFNTPNSVIIQILNDLKGLADQYPEHAMNLTITLWHEAIFETRLLAAHILGTIPPKEAMRLLTRIPEWLYETRDQRIRNALLTYGLARIRSENPAALSILISEWLKSPGQKTQTWGLHALIPLIKQVGFDDIPQIFEILRPAIETISPSTQMDIQTCINTMDSISHVETTHFLSEILKRTDIPQVRLIFQRILKGFSTEMQKELIIILKST